MAVKKSNKKFQLFRQFKCFDERFKNLQSQQSMLVQDGRILALDSDARIQKKIKADGIHLKQIEENSFQGRLLLPAFIECHTHSLFAGSRADEFELRNQGVSYLEIAARGGGILSTMKKTRTAKASGLKAQLISHLHRYMQMGVATVEVKSGYGLDQKNEFKMLDVIEDVGRELPIDVLGTYLGPHALPPEFQNHKQYLDHVIAVTLPALKTRNSTNRVDIFIEEKFFSKIESEAYLKKAKQLGFDLTIHANQLSPSGGAELALKYKARSADHVIHLSEKTIQKFGRSQTVPVLLPLADLYMRCSYPPARKLIDAGAEVALATDFNPGSCPSQDVMLTGLLARLEMKMSLPEVFRAYTYGAAKALGIHHEQGLLRPGFQAQFLVTEAELTDFFYSAGFVPIHDLYKHGQKLKRNQFSAI